MEAVKQITEQEFDEKYELVDNQFEESGWDGKYFETYGEQLDFVREMAKENRVVTIIEGESDEVDEEGYNKATFYYTSGLHLVNRFGFFVTKEPITEDFEVLVVE